MQKNAILFVTFIILEASLVTRGLPHPGSNEDNLTAPESSQNPQAVPITQEMDVLNTEQLHIARQRNVQGGVVSTEPESSQSNDATASSKGIQKTEKKNYTSITPEMLHKDSNVCVKCGRAIGKECTHRSKQAVNLLCFVTSGLCYACDQVFGNGITRGLPYPVCDTCGEAHTSDPQGASSSHEPHSESSSRKISELVMEELVNPRQKNVQEGDSSTTPKVIGVLIKEEMDNARQNNVQKCDKCGKALKKGFRKVVRGCKKSFCSTPADGSSL
ncbi:uncharacterized protein LOC126843359 isoform X33 [Adelges cooleyi]|uniref:uncharacterized protein LOC126843359 isoform X31 n=1 Tax=Adelges cooleyi TaxID=133065 RepID=UPI00217F94BA|nr:uncharacterized protein LOC126843359 isoform X31 [Adelges cooleyi]XP_050436810.1 uncharacterized protein LOC126843359 isoform X32 [Adelges cooleyi]XP_050436811.1 uncharacterized protein LOC126843359 isoform X33 [Adelges cooleyi]